MSEQEARRSFSQPGNDGSEDNAVTKTKSLAELALVYIGIPGATLYPLGLVALLMQVWLDPRFPYTDLTTAWTAVSLIPQTVVIGTGISLAYVSLVAVVLGMEVYFLTFGLLNTWHKRQDRSSPERLRNRRESNSLHRWGLYLLLLLPVAILEGVRDLNFDKPTDYIFALGFFVFSAGEEL